MIFENGAQQYLDEIFAAQLRMYQAHCRRREMDEAADDALRAQRMMHCLVLRYPYPLCASAYKRFVDGINGQGVTLKTASHGISNPKYSTVTTNVAHGDSNA